MPRNRLLKLAVLVLLVTAILLGVHPGGPRPAAASDCPQSYPTDCDGHDNCYQTCYYVDTACDEWGVCWCEYVSSGGTMLCPNWLL